MSTENVQVKSSVKSPKSKTVVSKAAKVAKSTAPSSKPKATHPTYLSMIINGIRELKESSGSSRQAILKFIIQKYNLDTKMAGSRARIELKKALASGILKHGRSNGMFKIGDKFKEEEKAKAKQARVKAQAAKKAAKSDSKPKKNVRKSPVKKVVKPAAVNTSSSAAPAKKAEPLKKAVVKKVVAKSASSGPKRKAPSAAAPAVSPTKKVKKTVAAKKPIVKKVAPKKVAAKKA